MENEFDIRKILKMNLQELERLYIRTYIRYQKLVLKGLILSKTNYGYIQDDLFQSKT